jgi:hypothetical protein
MNARTTADEFLGSDAPPSVTSGNATTGSTGTTGTVGGSGSRSGSTNVGSTGGTTTAGHGPCEFYLKAA